MLLRCQLELLYLFPKKNSVPPPAPIFVTFLLFIIEKKLLNEKNVEFDGNIGHAQYNCSVFMNNKQNNVRWTMYFSLSAYYSVYGIIDSLVESSLCC